MISERIALQRTRFGLTQKEFAKKIGYSQSYLAEIESGKVKPSRNFLEAVSRVFNMSIDALLTDSTIVDAIDAHRGTENPDIIFLYAFAQAEIDDIENLLRTVLAGRKLIIIDARGLKTWGQLLKAITGKEDKQLELSNVLKSMLLDEEIMLVLKNLSLSELPKKDIGFYVRDIFKIMDDAWLRKGKDEDFEEGKLKHIKPKSALILLDFPSFLERYYNEIAYYTIAIYPKHDLISESQGRPSRGKKT